MGLIIPCPSWDNWTGKITNFTVGMLHVMKTWFNFVNVAGGVYHNVIDSVIVMDYDTATAK